jgi:hypothetical protein
MKGLFALLPCTHAVDDVSTLLSVKATMKSETSLLENFMKGVDGRNVTQMASLMQNLVESQLFGDGVTETSGDGKLDSDISDALKTIKELLLGDIQRALTAEHADDQHSVGQLHKCWDQCATARDSDEQQVDDLWTIMQQSKVAHETCRSDVHAKYVDKVEKCNALDIWIEGLKCPDCYKEECVTIHDPSNTKVGDMLQAHISWAKSSYAEWSVKHAACAQAVRDHEAADLECDKTQGSFESGTCAHRQALWTSCTVNQMACCQRCSNEFNAEVNRVECAEKDRKIDWSATKKIECYIDVLMASPTDAELQAKCKADGKACINQWRENKYKSCEEVCVDIDYEAGDYYLVDGVNSTHRTDSAHGDRCTLHLDIHFPAMPSCVNCPPPVPGPCEEQWINTYYSAYDSKLAVTELEDENECHPDQHVRWWAYSRAECLPCAPLIGRTCGVGPHPEVKDSCFYGNQVKIFATDQMLKSDSYLNLGEVIVNGGAKMKVTLSDSWAAPHLKDNCVDGNPDTFCHSKNPKGWWVAFTLEEPTCIETITVLNRHDGWHDRIVGAGISVINQGTEIFTDTFDSTKKSYEWNLREGGKVDVSAALVTSSKSAMLAAGWSWTGCTTSHHGGDNLDSGIWCHSQEEMHLKIPMSGGPSWCTATFMNGYGNTAANGFVRFMKNGVQLGEARANSQATVSFEYHAGDALELWEGFAIAKVPANWIQCGPQPLEGPISAQVISEHDTYDHRFLAKNVLDSTWHGGSHNNGQTYLTRNCGGGWFVMQMQETGIIKEFQILNTCNTPYNDRSAKDISISLSIDNTNWENVINYQMQRCTPIKGDPLVLPSPNPIKAQYIKVELKTCYGASAGLNYFQAFR